MVYPLRTPDWLMRLLPAACWRMPAAPEAPAVYLTFDDGPCPGVTERVLDLLAATGARATFFCVGANVAAHPALFDRVRREGHAVGNHTHRHLDAWKTRGSSYLADIREAQALIGTAIFRPPYGHTTPALVRRLQSPSDPLRTIMWSLLSGDFDTRLDPRRCADQVLSRIRPGDIVVFHDSRKAAPRLLEALPPVLRHARAQGWQMLPIP
jgi:peptidoglycan/xylan/chitin deacetylase (PgdA/CDA1 family)